MTQRRQTTTINLGQVKIGSNAPISIQSMCNTKTTDIEATTTQINALMNAGCEIVRLAVPDIKSAEAIKHYKKEFQIPIVADIHFDHKLAIESIKNGADGIRINPGNIGSNDKVKSIIDHAIEHDTTIRIGVNSGSVAKHILDKHGVSAEALVESAMEHVRLFEAYNFNKVKLSVKASSVSMTINAYRLLAKKCDYPFHIGVTEAGTEFSGTIKSSIGIGTLLAEGIGDTIRVSLTDDPVKEIKVAKEILKALDIRKGLEIISCPTCGRTEIPLIKLTNEVEQKLRPFEHLNIKVAVMGCEVNGPGEAREADYGIAGGKNEGLLFQKGKIIMKLPADKLVQALVELIEFQRD
jgi:(E)-4-hydroxy-3-methylbut-2-enyl-diphosphate synthase